MTFLSMKKLITSGNLKFYLQRNYSAKILQNKMCSFFLAQKECLKRVLRAKKVIPHRNTNT